MKLLETSYLVDCEKGREVARSYFERHEHEDLAASMISMFELALGVVWDGKRDLPGLRESLLWVDFVELTIGDAIEGARIQAELQSEGQRIPFGDVMIAGVARNRDATLVAGDDYFDRIDGLAVENHRS